GVGMPRPCSVIVHPTHRSAFYQNDREGEKALNLDPAKLASRKRETRFASPASRAGIRLDRAGLASHGSEPQSNGGANSAHIKRNRPTRRASDHAGAKHSRTFSDERDAHLAVRRKGKLGRPGYSRLAVGHPRRARTRTA